MDVSVIVDKINIKNLPEVITNYLRQYSIKEFNNLRSFYSRLFEFISDDVKDSYLNRVLKYLSYDAPSVINIFEDFNEGVYDKELMKFSKYLVKIINETDQYSNLYESLNRNVNFLFYESHDEYCKVKTFNNDANYDMFIFSLLKHAFMTYKINIPGIMANRLLEESMTLSFNTEHRKRVIQASAELGNEIAISLHAAHIYDENRDEAIKFLIKNKNRGCDLWQVAYELECDSISKYTIQHIKNELKGIELENDFTNKITITTYGKEKYYDLSLLFAIKLYYYIACKFNFTKAYNSLGKLMIFDIISYENDRKKTIELAKTYLKKSISMGNLNSMTNLAIYYYKNRDDIDFDYVVMKKSLEQAACLGDISANCYYGKIMIEEGNFKDGVEYLKYASDRNYGLACYELGKYYELKSDYEQAVESYKKAILNKYFDAAYNIAVLFKNINSVSNIEKFSNDNIIYYLKTYMDKMNPDIRKKTEKILREYN